MSKTSWRDSIKIHPVADMFPMLDDPDLAALGENIRRNGLTSPIAMKIEKGRPLLIDGRNRLDAMEKVGLRVKFEKSRTGTWKLLAEECLDDGRWCGVSIVGNANSTVTIVEGDATEYTVSANIHRRHLTTSDKKRLAEALLKDNPERSNRSTADLVKLDPKTVGVVRCEMEKREEIPNVEKRVDTRGRQQPAKRPAHEPTDQQRAINQRNAQDAAIKTAAAKATTTGRQM
jgi:hypothetical protein